jgi:hypothetical protein
MISLIVASTEEKTAKFHYLQETVRIWMKVAKFTHFMIIARIACIATAIMLIKGLVDFTSL